MPWNRNSGSGGIFCGVCKIQPDDRTRSRTNRSSCRSVWRLRLPYSASQAEISGASVTLNSGGEEFRLSSPFSLLKQKNSRRICFNLPGFSLTSVLCDGAAVEAEAEHCKPAVRDPMPAEAEEDIHRTVPAEAAEADMHRLEPVSHRPAGAVEEQPCRPRAQ